MSVMVDSAKKKKNVFVENSQVIAKGSLTGIVPA